MAGEEIVNREMAGRIIKLQQDIADFEKIRSKLQNEIEAREEESKKKIAAEYAEHQEKIRTELGPLNKQKQEVQDLVNKTKTDCATQTSEIQGEWERLESEQEAFNKEKSDFEQYKVFELKKIDESQNRLIATCKTNNLQTTENGKITRELDDRKYELDNREFQVNYKVDEGKKLLEEIVSQQTKVDEKYQAIKKEREAITAEKNEIVTKLTELKNAEAELNKLSFIKEDLKKLENLKIEVDARLKEKEELSKTFAKKKEELDEREQTLNEKQRVLVLDMRKNDEKIQTIQKLRDEMKKNA